MLDSASGSIHAVDEIAYDAINKLEGSGGDKKETADWLLDRYVRELSAADLSELFAEIDELRQLGKLFSADVYDLATGKSELAPLKALCLNVAHMCNMSCSYCFAGRGEYGRGTTLMPAETGTRAIDFLIENSQGRKNLDVDFFGGEPLLNWETVKDIVKYARSVERGSGKEFRFTLTTNGLLIDDDVIGFANKEMHNVVLSLDGRKETNDAMLRLGNGRGSYSEIVPKIKRLVEARQGREDYIRGTFTRNNLDFLDDILHIADLGFTELSMEPVVAKSEMPHALTMEDLPKLCEQYELLAAEMMKRDKEGRGFTFYHFKLDLTGGPCLHKRLAGCGVGVEYLAVTPEGELYPCHQFVGDESFLLGDVWRGLSDVDLQNSFNECSICSREECKACWARLYCSGGCAANAWNDTGSINEVYKIGCELFKKRLECAIMMKVAAAIEVPIEE